MKILVSRDKHTMQPRLCDRKNSCKGTTLLYTHTSIHVFTSYRFRIHLALVEKKNVLDKSECYKNKKCDRLVYLPIISLTSTGVLFKERFFT